MESPKPLGRRAPHYGTAFFALASTGLCVAALVTTEWYNISYTGTDINYGVFRGCMDGVCAKLDFNVDYTTGCTRTGKDLKTRVLSVFGLTIAGGALSLLTALLVMLSPSKRVLGFVGCVTSMLAFGALAAASVLFAFTWHKWYYCDKPYCSEAFGAGGGTGSCESFFGYSYAFVIVAAASMVVGTVLAIVCACKYLPPAEAQAPMTEGAAYAAQDAPVAEPTAAAAATPTPQRVQNRSAAAQPQSPPPQQSSAQRNDGGALAENRRTTEMRALTSTTTNNQSLDGWELDDNTGLYWSDREKLFYDPISGHFYDPESELWYDPSTEQWYQGAEQ